MKSYICAVFGIIGSGLSYFFGGWDLLIQTLVIFQAVDLLTGLICAAVFKKSPKTKGGKLESRSMFKGLMRKALMLLVVLVGVRLDALIGTDLFVRNACCLSFILSEALSIIENLGLCGVKLPPVIYKAIQVLQDQEEAQK